MNCLLAFGHLDCSTSNLSESFFCARKRANTSSFFASWFHCLDATVIVASFLIDVCLRGIVEEVGSLVVVGRLWRVFKVSPCSRQHTETWPSLRYPQIIDELSAGASEQMEPLHERIEDLEKEIGELKHENEELNKRQAVNI